jgi:hypothetical protein
LIRAIFLLVILLFPSSLDRAGAQPRAQKAHVSQQEALRIARGYGMVVIREIERDDGGWEIEGRDHRGRELEITISRQGRVVQVDRGDNDD